jgi:hypothetical protein
VKIERVCKWRRPIEDVKRTARVPICLLCLFDLSYTLLEFRLISCESAWEEAVAVFMTKWLIPLHRLFYAKLV